MCPKSALEVQPEFSMTIVDRMAMLLLSIIHSGVLVGLYGRCILSPKEMNMHSSTFAGLVTSET